jgi:hypothetical protein
MRLVSYSAFVCFVVLGALAGTKAEGGRRSGEKISTGVADATA